MTEIIIWEGDHTCINTVCNNKIPDMFVERQKNSKKYRVCVKCRSNRSLRWRCIGCNNVMYDTQVNIGMFYCSKTCSVKYHNDKRHGKIKYSVKPHKIKGKKYKKCGWCSRDILTGQKLFCNEVCKRKNSRLIKHRRALDVLVSSRSQARLAINQPHIKAGQLGMKVKYNKKYNMIRYNVKKLVMVIKNRNI